MALPVQYFQKLVESSPDIIISVDKSGTIIYYNDGARQMRTLKQRFVAAATIKGGFFLKGAPAPAGRPAGPG